MSKESLLDAFAEAIVDYIEATTKLNEMHAEYTGYSPDYHLASWDESAGTARSRVGIALDAYIDARIAASKTEGI